MNNEDIVVVKLVNGDQILGRILNHTPDGVLLYRPITLKFQTMIKDGVMGERLTTSLFCPVSSDESFVFDVRHCLHISKLHPGMINQYNRLSSELYENLNYAVKLDNHDEPEEKQEPVEKPDNIVYH